MSSLFKSIYHRFSAGLLDLEQTDRFATSIRNRRDINDNDIWEQVGLLEDIEYLDSSIAANDIKSFIKKNWESETCFSKYLNDSLNTNDRIFFDDLDKLADSYLNTCQFQYSDIFDKEKCFYNEVNYIKIGNKKYEIAHIDLERYQEEIEAKREEIREIISKLKVFLIGKTQLRLLRNLIANRLYHSFIVDSYSAIPIVYDLREYWDIVGSLKKIDSSTVYEKHNLMNFIFLKEYNNGIKKSNWPTQLLN